jgi:hypothetical protein
MHFGHLLNMALRFVGFFCSMAGRFSEEENESKEGCGGLMIRFPVVPFLLFMFFTPSNFRFLFVQE